MQGVPGTTEFLESCNEVVAFGDRARLAGRHQGRLRRRRSRHARRASPPTRPQAALESAQSEALKGFGRDECYVERYLTWPRHIEMQIIGDTHGNVRVGRRARLLGPAPPPEAHRGEPGTGVPRRDPPGHGRGRGQGRQGVRLLQRRHRRVPVPGRRVLLPRDEHPPPGRAPRHRDGVGHRPRRRADPRRRRASRCRSPRTTSTCRGHSIEVRVNAEDPGRRQVPPLARPHHHAGARRRLRRPLGRRLRVRRRGQPVLRQPRRQAHRVGQGPRHRHRPHDPGAARVPHRGHQDHDPRRPRHPRAPRLRRGQALHQVGRGHPRPHRGGRRARGRPVGRRRGARGQDQARRRRRGQRQALLGEPLGARVGRAAPAAGGGARPRHDPSGRPVPPVRWPPVPARSPCPCRAPS